MSYYYPDRDDFMTCQLIEEVNNGNYWEESEQFVLGTCLKYLEGKADLHILDLGCGKGRLLPVMAPYASELTGAEPDPDRCRGAVEYAPDAVQALAPKCDLKIFNGDISCDGVGARAPFDVVLSSHVVQHIPFAMSENMIRKASEQMKPGGWLFLTTTNGNDCDEYSVESMDEKMQRISRKTDRQGFEQAFGQDGYLPVAFYAQKTMKDLFTRAGLECCELLGYHYYAAKEENLTAKDDERLNKAGQRSNARDILYICRKKEN